MLEKSSSGFFVTPVKNHKVYNRNMTKNIFDIKDDAIITELDLVEIPEIDEEFKQMGIELEKLIDFDITE